MKIRNNKFVLAPANCRKCQWGLIRFPHSFVNRVQLNAPKRKKKKDAARQGNAESYRATGTVFSFVVVQTNLVAKICP